VTNKRRRWEAITLGNMYGSYAGMMLCRNAIVVVSMALMRDPTLGMDEIKYGQILAVGSAGGLLGKLFLGAVVDRFGGRDLFLVTLAAVVSSTMVFGVLPDAYYFFIVNFLAHGIKAAGWPAMGTIVRKWYSRTKYGRIWGLISTSSRLGVITSTIVLGYLLTFLSWRVIFFIAGGITAIALPLAFFLLNESPSKVGLSPPSDLKGDDPAEVNEQNIHHLAGTTIKEALLNFATSQVVWMMAFSIGFITVLMEFNSFVPLYMAKLYEVSGMELSSGLAGMTAAAFPTGCVVAALVGGFVYDRLSKRQHIYAFGGLMVFAAGCAIALWLIPQADLRPAVRLYLSIVTVFLFGFAVAPAYYIPMSVFSIEYGGPHLGLLMGLIDAFGYLGATIFNMNAGPIIKNHGFGPFLLLLFGCCVIGGALITRFMYLDAKAHQMGSAAAQQSAG